MHRRQAPLALPPRSHTGSRTEAMVFYFTCSDPKYTIYMGRDKYENEELIRYGWPEARMPKSTAGASGTAAQPRR